MSIEREIIQRLNESRRLDESWPPVLNSLDSRYKNVIRTKLTRAGIDIQNTPYKETVITNGRDPRLKGSDVVIFELGAKMSSQSVGVWFNGEFIIDTYIWDFDKNLSRMSWKNILEISKRIIVMEFDMKSREDLINKRAERAEAKKDMVKRYTNPNDFKKELRRSDLKLDKSGYAFDPNKYKKLLADMKVDNGDKVLQQAKEVYMQASKNIDKIDWDAERDVFSSYQYVMQEIPREFANLSKILKQYEQAKKDTKNPDISPGNAAWNVNYYKKEVSRAINSLNTIISKAKKFI